MFCVQNVGVYNECTSMDAWAIQDSSSLYTVLYCAVLYTVSRLHTADQKLTSMLDEITLFLLRIKALPFSVQICVIFEDSHGGVTKTTYNICTWQDTQPVYLGSHFSGVVAQLVEVWWLSL